MESRWREHSARSRAMSKFAASVFVLLTSLNAACLNTAVDTPLNDRVTTAAQDLRWTKGTESQAKVPLDRFDRPVLVLALPPGRYGAGDLDSLVSESDGRRW